MSEAVCHPGEGGSSEVWRAPALSIHRIGEITRLGFASNCDGGFGLAAIDGDAIFCRRRR